MFTMIFKTHLCTPFIEGLIVFTSTRSTMCRSEHLYRIQADSKDTAVLKSLSLE